MPLPPGLQGRRILVISPQPWDHLPISKHHYAEHLGAANTVFFLSPPDPALPPGRIEGRDTAAPGVKEVRWRPRVPRLLRFHAPALYRLLIAREGRRLARWIGCPLDLVWCFDFNSFPDLRVFEARSAVFHPVDPLSSARQARIAESADLVLSVSPEILFSVTREVPGVPAVVIPHGIGREFGTLARTPAGCAASRGHCGYFGNLERPILDVALLIEVVSRNPKITFHFWGPVSPGGVVATALGALPNARLHGVVAQRELARQAAGMDAFLLAYREHGTESDLSNSHKILEYFATGRVVISTFMSCHAEAADLLVRTPRRRSGELPRLFADVMAHLAEHNAPERIARRKALAAEHSYEALLTRIGALLDRSPKSLPMRTSQ